MSFSTSSNFKAEGFIPKSLYVRVITELRSSRERVRNLEEENQRLKEGVSKLSSRELDLYFKHTKEFELFERFAGHQFEKKGYKVEYHSIENRKKGIRGDEGIDLICRNRREIMLVQCKSQKNSVGVEIVSTLAGSKEAYVKRYSVKDKDIKGVICTLSDFSPDAYKLGQLLDIQLLIFLRLRFVRERFKLVKCKNATHKYYLPTDISYDDVGFSVSEGDCYFETIEEAEKAGFCRVS